MVDHTVAATQEAVIGNNNSLVTIADPATNGGVLVDEAGIDVYDNTGQKTVDLAAADGSATFGVVADEKYLKFNGATGNIAVGRETEFKGADSYNNDAIYFNTYFESVDGWDVWNSGTGSQVTIGGTGAFIRAGSVANAFATIYKTLQNVLGDHSWGKNRYFKAGFRLATNLTNAEIYLGIGSSVDGGSDPKIMFKLVGASSTSVDVYAYHADASSGATSTNLSVALSSGSSATLELVHTTGTNVEFYVNGVLEGTITTNLPGSGDTKWSNRLEFKSVGNGSNAATFGITVGQMKYLQEA
jgi:hypothetical protein